MEASRSLVRWFVCALSALALVCFFAGSASAQGDFDFSDDGGGGGDGGGDFDFSGGGGGDTAGGGGTDVPDVEVVMPDGSKPIIVAWFEETEAADRRITDRLTDAMVEAMNEFEDYDAVNGIIIKQDLDKMSLDERDACIYDPICISEMGAAIKVQKIVIGRLIQSPDSERPTVSLELIDVETTGLANLIEYEAGGTVKAQQKELRPASYKLFGKQIPRADTGGKDLTSSSDDDKPWISTGQLVAAISTGVAGLALIGAGAGIGAGAQSTHDDLLAKIDARSITQVEAEKMLDDANSQALVANILYGVGGVALVTTVILFLVRPGDEIAEDQPNRIDETSGIDFYFNPEVGAEGAGFTAGFTF